MRERTARTRPKHRLVHVTAARTYGTVDPNGYAAAALQAAALTSVGGAWTERTARPGTDGNDFSDSPQYIDPTGVRDTFVGDRSSSP